MQVAFRSVLARPARRTALLLGRFGKATRGRGGRLAVSPLVARSVRFKDDVVAFAVVGLGMVMEGCGRCWCVWRCVLGRFEIN